ncbi:MAG: leishmanolysin-related zinc metalloendopeptidase [Gemmatimonadales bacterium]
MPRSHVLKRCIAALAVVAALTGCRNSDIPGSPAAIAVVNGNNQQAAVGTSLPVPPTVVVRDAGNNVVAGAVVRFTVTTGGGTALGDTAVTDATGRATVGEWIMGTAPGTNTLRATVSGTTLAASVTATAVAGTGVSLHAAGVTGFVGLVGQSISPPPAVQVLDGFGNPAGGVAVTFAVAEGDGSATGIDVTSDANGVARVGSWTLGATGGLNVLTARIAAGPVVSFTAQGLSAAPLLVPTSAVAQSGYLGFPVANVPRVLVTDALGHSLPGVPVTFTITAGDGEVAGGSVVTDATGTASPADWRIGNGGTSTVTATSGLGALPISFTATGVAPSFLIDVRFLTPMSADERDAFVAAATRWMRIITAHLTPVTVNLPVGACTPLQPVVNETITDVVIFAEVSPIDGVGGILGSAGPCAQRSTNSLTAVGTMQFDSADLLSLQANGQLVATITHEMAHVLGFGTIWSTLNLTTGEGGPDPIFIGSNALAQWPPFATAIGYSGQAVPLEMCGGAGTRDAHWREHTTCSSGVPVFGAELMTGFIEAPGIPMPLSRMTIAAMQDLGYQVDYSQADQFHGLLVARGATTPPPTPINEQLHHATWQVTPGGETHRLP